RRRHEAPPCDQPEGPAPRGAAGGRRRPRARDGGHPVRMQHAARSGLGGRLRRRRVRPVHAGRARPLRLLPLPLLAGAGGGLADELPELDADLRRGGPGLGEDRPRVPMIAGLATLALLAQAPPTSTGAPVTTGGTSFYLRMWPDQFVKFDPATDTVV